MSIIDYILLGVAVAFELFFFGLLAYVKLSKPKKKNPALPTTPEHQEKFEDWLRMRNRTEETFRPVALHIIALSALGVWLLYRVVLSFL